MVGIFGEISVILSSKETKRVLKNSEHGSLQNSERKNAKFGEFAFCNFSVFLGIAESGISETVQGLPLEVCLLGYCVSSSSGVASYSSGNSNGNFLLLRIERKSVGVLNNN